MAIDLNEPPPSDDGVLPGPIWGHQQGHEAAAHGPYAGGLWAQHPQEEEAGHGAHVVLPPAEHNEEESESQPGGSFDLNIAYEEDNNSDVDAFNAAAEAACFDYNTPLDSDSDDDAHVYAQDFHVILGQDNLSGEAHGQQGSQHGNTPVVKRVNLTDEERQNIYEALLLRSNRGKLRKNTTTIVARLFNVKRSYVQALWRTVKVCLAAGVPVNVRSKTKVKCGRKKITIDLSRVRTIELDKRTNLLSLSKELGVSNTTVHRWFKEGLLRRHSNTIKPYLRDNNKKGRLQYCVAMADSQTVDNEPKFIDMKNIIHIDEKWFNTTEKVKKVYLLPDEEDPERTIQNKNFIPICMLLCGVAPPRYDDEGNCYFDGKIGIWPFVRKEPAQRASRNRPRGTLVTKSINMTRDISRSYLVSKVLPAIVASWPRESIRETIWIQQDNARTHIDPNDQVFRAAVAQTGLDIRIYNQPPNSPDLNVLDLGFFASLQSMAFLKECKNMDELIENVQQKFSSYDPSKLRRVFLTLQGCMLEVMRVAGGNRYPIPHMYKDGLEQAGALSTSLNVDKDLYDSVLQKLAE